MTEPERVVRETFAILNDPSIGAGEARVTARSKLRPLLRETQESRDGLREALPRGLAMGGSPVLGDHHGSLTIYGTNEALNAFYDKLRAALAESPEPPATMQGRPYPDESPEEGTELDRRLDERESPEDRDGLREAVEEVEVDLRDWGRSGEPTGHAASLARALRTALAEFDPGLSEGSGRTSPPEIGERQPPVPLAESDPSEDRDEGDWTQAAIPIEFDPSSPQQGCTCKRHWSDPSGWEHLSINPNCPVHGRPERCPTCERAPWERGTNPPTCPDPWH